MFIPVTHYYSGERVFVLANSVTLIREREEGKTLIVADRGMYVTEDAVLIKDMIESVLLSNSVINEGMMMNVQEEEETKE